MAEKLFQDVETQFGGGMRFSKGFILKVSDDSGASQIEGLIVRAMDIRAQRPVTTLYDLTSNRVYYVSARSVTQLGLQRICGPRGIVGSFYRKLGNVCNAAKNYLSFSFPSGCTDSEQTGMDTPGDEDYDTITVKNGVLMDVAFSCSTQDYIISENCQLTGTELEVSRVGKS